MRATLTCCLVLLATAATAAERAPSFPKRTNYSSARSSLITLGWKPAPTEPPPNECAKYDGRCEYPETESCSGTGRGFCSYQWRRGEMLIEILTEGDDRQIVTSVSCVANCR